MCKHWIRSKIYIALSEPSNEEREKPSKDASFEISKDANLETYKYGNPEASKDANLKISLPSSHGTSLSKEVNEEHTSLERKEPKAYGESLNFDNHNSEDMSDLGFNFKDLSSKVL